jgi:hypothetical protein
VTFVGELSCGADTSLLSTIVACFNSEWRTHGATSKSLKPEPKGEGTVRQRTLIRPNRTHQKLEDTERGRASYTSPARLGAHQNDDEPRFMLCMAGLFACHARCYRLPPANLWVAHRTPLPIQNSSASAHPIRVHSPSKIRVLSAVIKARSGQPNASVAMVQKRKRHAFAQRGQDDVVAAIGCSPARFRLSPSAATRPSRRRPSGLFS